jgi:hypothetical protein
MFHTEGANTARVENCTIVDNKYQWLTRNYNDKNKLIVFENTVLVGNNTSNQRRDVSGLESKHLLLSNCVYGVMGECTKKPEGMANGECWAIGTRAAARFVEEGDAPLTPSLLSPLRGKGRVMPWMAAGTDLAGKPRLRDGLADVGCYQCWLLPKETTILVR